jgi:hypothetical protein
MSSISNFLLLMSLLLTHIVSRLGGFLNRPLFCVGDAWLKVEEVIIMPPLLHHRTSTLMNQSEDKSPQETHNKGKSSSISEDDSNDGSWLLDESIEAPENAEIKTGWPQPGSRTTLAK